MESASILPSVRAAGCSPSYFNAWIAAFILPWYRPKATARTNAGGTIRQRRQRSASSSPAACAGASSVSPQRAHAGPLWIGNSDQHALQIGAKESCGRGEPQRLQKLGRRAQLKASTGLRSTRATARHRDAPDGVTSNVSEPESLRKTHLSSGLRSRHSD